MSTISSKLWKGKTPKKPLGKIIRAATVAFILIVIIGVLFGGGYWSGKRIADNSWSRKYDEQQKANQSKVFKDLYPALEEGTTPTEYTGWVDYVWTGVNLKLSHPSTWEVKIVSANQIDLITPDEKYSLKIAYGKNQDSLDLSLPEGSILQKVGQLEILGTAVEKDSMLVDGVSRAYAYPKAPTEINNGQFFWSTFSALEPTDNTNIEELDYRSVGEKILRSIASSD